MYWEDLVSQQYILYSTYSIAPSDCKTPVYRVSLSFPQHVYMYDVQYSNIKLKTLTYVRSLS
jgi:hypothetical protein